MGDAPPLKGSLVIVPRYQSVGCGFTFGSHETEKQTAAWAVGTGIGWLRANAVTKPDVPASSWCPTCNGTKGMVLIGHSWGGTLATTIASRAAAYGLPVPQAILAVEAGQLNNTDIETAGIPNGTLFNCMWGADDNVANHIGCDRLWHALPAGLTYKNYIKVYGSRGVLSDHGFPQTGGAYLSGYGTWLVAAVDNLEWRATWKLSVAMRDCVQFWPVNCDYAYTSTNNGSVNRARHGDMERRRPLAGHGRARERHPRPAALVS